MHSNPARTLQIMSLTLEIGHGSWIGLDIAEINIIEEIFGSTSCTDNYILFGTWFSSVEQKVLES